MSLTEKQVEYLQNCNHRWNIKTGSTGSGKSFLDYAVTIPKRIMSCRGEGHIILLGNTQGTLERNILDPMRELWPSLVGQIRDKNKINLFGRSAYALGADSKKHIARIQGTTIEYAYGDEITTWEPGVFEMLKSRTRCTHSHFDGTCNPDNPGHWFKTFLDSGADIYQQQYNIDDNPHLPVEFVKQLKQEYAGTVYYDRYIRGLWVAAEGAIYRAFTDNPEQFFVDGAWIAEHPLAECTIGVDFGGNGSGHAFVCTGFTRGYRELVTLEEWYHKGEITPEQLENAFVDFALMCTGKYGTRIAYCDSAESTLIKGLAGATIRAKIHVEVAKARKFPINDRIRFLCRMMAADRYKINPKCKHVAEALRTALWDSKHITEDVRLDNGSTNIDSLDALEYSFETKIETMSYTGYKAVSK